jgi:hypothetical protein
MLQKWKINIDEQFFIHFFIYYGETNEICQMSSIINEYQINILGMWLISYKIINSMWNIYGFLLRVL